MRSRSSVQVKSCSNNPQISPLSDFQFMVEVDLVRRWNSLHPVAVNLLDRYKELIAYEVPICRVVDRLPMLFNLGKFDLSETQLQGMKKSITNWKMLNDFYTKTFSKIEKQLKSDDSYSIGTVSQRHRALCRILKGFEKEIDAAHVKLANTISGLFEAGYSHDSIQPRLGIYRLIA